MSARVGVELTPEGLRAVAVRRGSRTPVRTFEAAWDPQRPESAIAALRESLGSVDRVALSIGLGFLHVKRVSLPPTSAADRKRMLALEPERYFPVQVETLAIALASDGELVYAADAMQIERWTAAFEQWAPVVAVEPSPVSIARVLGGSGSDGLYDVPAGPDERGLLELRGGRLESVRRVAAHAGAVGGRELPSVPVSAALLAALGATQSFDAPVEQMLITERLAGIVRGRRAAGLALAGAACAAALIFSLWALDRSRERELAETRAAAARIAPSAASGIELQSQLAAMRRESAVLARLRSAASSDAMRVLAALSERLPPGAAVASLTLQGGEWRVEGTAADASQIVPLLDADERFEDVRILSASTRFRDGGRTSETFSVAFHARAAS